MAVFTQWQWQIPEAVDHLVAQAILQDELVRGMQIVMSELLREVTFLTPTDRGRLKGSYEAVIRRESGFGVTGTFSSNAPYAQFVEEGSQPHWPPEAPILGWVRRTFNVRGKRAKRAAFFVRRKIARKGTPAHHMLKTAWEERVQPLTRDIFLDALATATKRFAREG